jgi:hypothetical protein
MGYQTLDWQIEATLDAATNIIDLRDHRDSLGPLEWDAIEIARRDGPRSFNPDGWHARIARALFGVEIARPLANKRLEALRRFSVRAWFWDLVRTKDMRAFFDAGYSSNDAWRILSYVSVHRGFLPSVENWPA